jgi:hypothetical protein
MARALPVGKAVAMTPETLTALVCIADFFWFAMLLAIPMMQDQRGLGCHSTIVVPHPLIRKGMPF